MGKPFMSEADVLEGAPTKHVTPIRVTRFAGRLASGVLGALDGFSQPQIGKQHSGEAFQRRTVAFTRQLRSFHGKELEDGIVLTAHNPTYTLRMEAEAHTDDRQRKITAAAMQILARGGRETYFALQTEDELSPTGVPDDAISRGAKIAAIDLETFEAFEGFDFNDSERAAFHNIMRRVFDDVSESEADSTRSLITAPLALPRARLLEPMTPVLLEH